MELRRALLTSSSALLLCASAAYTADQPGLKDVAPKGFLIGAAVNMKLVDGHDAAGAAIVTRQFNSITDENVLKPGPIHPAPDRYNFEPGDRYVAWGQAHGMFVVGHCLVWHQQTPGWFFAGTEGAKLDRETALGRMREHIATVVGRYRGRIHSWDVVNEALEEDGSLRRTAWRDAIGEDYIAKAFQFAREADPGAELYYNDYNLWKPEKRAGAIRLVRELERLGVRIDGIGEQAHWGLGDPPTSLISAMLDEFSGLRLKLALSELDMDVLPRDPQMWGADLSQKSRIRAATDVYKGGLPEEKQQELARRYAEVFALFLRHHELISRVTFWGVTDADSWLDDFPIPGRTNYPLLWDREGKPKPAFFAVAAELRRGTPPTASGP